MCLSGARGEGAMAWATYQGEDDRERIDPSHCKRSQSATMNSITRIYPSTGSVGVKRAVTRPPTQSTPPCAQGGMKIHTHQDILHGLVPHNDPEGVSDSPPREEESTTPFKQETNLWSGYLLLKVVVGSGAVDQVNKRWSQILLAHVRRNCG